MFKKLTDWFRSLASRPPALPSADKLVRLCELCSKPQVIHITLMEQKVLRGERHVCEDCVGRVLLSMMPAPHESRTSSAPTNDSQEIEIAITTLVISEIHDQQVMVLQECDGERKFSIVTGIFEAYNIDRILRKLPSPRPLVHDAWLSTILTLGYTLQAAVITDLRDFTYFAELRVSGPAGLRRVDVRCSDAIAMAMKAEVPILMPRWLLADLYTPDQDP